MKSLVFVLSAGVFVNVACDGPAGPPGADGGRIGGDASASSHDGSSIVPGQDGGPLPTFPDGGGSSGTLAPMPRISDGLPSYASSGDPGAANDGNVQSIWSAGRLPAWLAYDLSRLPAAQRGRVLVAFNNFEVAAYYGEEEPPDGPPRDYTIETHAGPGGGAPPTDGWTVRAQVRDNLYVAREHVIDIEGANWLRIHVTAATGGHVGLDLEVYDASNGFIDGWLIMGDSISYMAFSRWISNLPTLLVERGVTDHTPFFDCAALGGTSSGHGQEVLDRALPVFAGRFVTLNYGTNDNDADFYHESMAALVERVLAAGKIPVIPTVPWPNDNDAHRMLVLELNERLEQIFDAYPDAVRGPDLHAYFQAHPELTAAGDVHPDSDAVRRVWADWMAETIYR